MTTTRVNPHLVAAALSLILSQRTGTKVKVEAKEIHHDLYGEGKEGRNGNRHVV